MSIGYPAIRDEAIEFVLARGVLERVKTLNDDLKVELAHRVHPTLGSSVAAPFVRFMLAPARQALPPGARLIYTQPGEAFGFYIQIALIAGVVFAAPVIMYQVWRFIAPGLYVREKRLAVPFVGLTTAGGIGGALFGHYIVFP